MLYVKNELTKELAKIKLEDLVADAVERKDKGALEWLKEQALKAEDTRVDKKTGREFTVPMPITTIRVEYLKKYTNWQPKGNTYSKDAARKKKEDMFAKAFASLD